MSTRVLIVDDNPDMREVMKLALAQAGYEVDAAPDGARAIEMQRARPADILVTDIFMPEREGIETIQQFRAEFPDIAIVAMSGGGDLPKKHDYLSIAEQLGAQATLRKPFEIDQLIGTLKRLKP